MPDEVYLAPRCGLWSPMQSINALTPEKREKLSIQRQQHHDVHLQFCKVIYIRQVRDGRHAHLEQPQAALSWKTKALSRLPGHRVAFDQCKYGACCLDKDGLAIGEEVYQFADFKASSCTGYDTSMRPWPSTLPT